MTKEDGRSRAYSRRKVLLATAGLSMTPMLEASALADATGNAAAPTGPGRLFGPGPAGWWDSERVSCPKVLRGEDGVWRMWYYGRDADFDRQILLPTGRVGHAISEDGIHWERVRGPLTMGSVFEPHPREDRFDSGHVGISDIQFRDGLYWMWYFGGDRIVRDVLGFPVKGFPLRPGCAVSRDGLNWTRIEGPYNGALLDAGGPEDFDAIMAAWPQVIEWPDGSWRMYYHGLDQQQRYTLGWAESADGLNWEKRGPLLGPGASGRFDDLGVATRHMLRLDDRWVMFYEGCGDIGSRMQVDRQLGVAVSTDGLDWQRVPGPNANGSVLTSAETGSGPDGEPWDIRLGCPHVVAMDDGSLRLYYIGSNERRGDTELDTVNQIGMAVSDGDILTWQRWEAIE